MVYYFSLLTLTLCIVLFIFNSKINRTVLYLIGFLVPMALYGILHHLIFFNESALKLALINVHLLPIYYLTGPMLYFYVRSTLRDNHVLSKNDYLHFLPAIIGLITVLPYIFKSFDYKLAVAQQFIDDPNSIKIVRTHWFYPNYINVIARPILLFGYGTACLAMIWKYTSKKRNYSPMAQRNTLIKWLISITIIAFLTAISYILMTYLFFSTTNLKKEVFNQLPISTFTGFFFSIIPIVIIIFPEILYGMPRASASPTAIDEDVLPIGIQQENIIEDPFSETALRILNYMEEEKPYLNPKFSINDIIENLAIPKHHVYYCFNNIIQTKFTVLRTNYRIAHAKGLLLSKKVDVMTIEGIGLESGFASKSNFFAVFKEATRLSPYDFMEQYKSGE